MPLTIKDLRAVLDELPDDMPIVLAKDAEGNGFSPLDEADPALYQPYSTWSGQALHPDDEAEADDNAFRALVLWPVN